MFHENLRAEGLRFLKEKYRKFTFGNAIKLYSGLKYKYI